MLINLLVKKIRGFSYYLKIVYKSIFLEHAGLVLISDTS